MTDGDQRASNIRRAAGAAEPALANRFNVIVDMIMGNAFRVRLQWVDVEEVLTVQRHPAEHRIVERPFHHVGVMGVAFHLQHPAGEHHQAN